MPDTITLIDAETGLIFDCHKDATLEDMRAYFHQQKQERAKTWQRAKDWSYGQSELNEMQNQFEKMKNIYHWYK